MSDKLCWVFKNLHLLVSVTIVVPTGIIYGAAPATLLPRHLEIPVMTIDLSNFLRAIMCLYLGISAIWILGISKKRYWKTATQLNILFMLTLAIGRLLSMALDVLPTRGYIFGVIAELVLGLYALYQLRRDQNEPRIKTKCF